MSNKNSKYVNLQNLTQFKKAIMMNLFSIDGGII